jgi:hypothetical protein
MNKKLIAIIISVLIVVGGGIGVYAVIQNNGSNDKTPETTKVTNTTTWENKVLTINVAEAKNALEMMQQNATIVTSGTGENAYVTAVNGVTADTAKHEFWEFDVNGTMASVGAGSYTTKVGDVLTLKISTY